MDSKIISKIQNLLELAYDSPSDEEGQTALLMAQKLMVKHQLSMSDIERSSKCRTDIGEIIGTQGRRLPWWQEHLASILGSNLRCQTYRTRLHKEGITRIIFFGYYEDAELCTKVYEGAILYLKYRLKRLTPPSIEIKRKDYKKSYLYGFLAGLDARFREQAQSSEEFALVVQVPAEVVEEQELRMGILKDRMVNPGININTFDPIAYLQGCSHAGEVKLLPEELLGEQF